MKPPLRVRPPPGAPPTPVSRPEPLTSDPARTSPLLPPAYRGKTSGEFLSVGASETARPVIETTPAGATQSRQGPQSTASVVRLAQQYLATLDVHDDRRRLLELGILRCDTSLLSQLLEQLAVTDDG